MSHSVRSATIAFCVSLSGLTASVLAVDSGFSRQDRIDCHRAVEEVRWSNRIWPDSNPGPKPSFAEVMSEEALKRKAEDAVRMSAALDKHYGLTVTPQKLQNEMDRMARQTRSPEQLQAMFAALDDDPYRIAECLVRPLLAQRKLYSAFVRDNRVHGQQRMELEARLKRVNDISELDDEGISTTVYRLAQSEGEDRQRRADLATSGEAEQSDPHGPAEISLNLSEWQELQIQLGLESPLPAPETMEMAYERSSGPDSVRDGLDLEESDSAFFVRQVMEAEEHRVVVNSVSWPKRSFERWWSQARSDMGPGEVAQTADLQLPEIVATRSDAGARSGGENWYAPVGPPEARDTHTAIWTGSEMIIWGGYVRSSGSALETGGRYDPATDSWAPITTDNAPDGRYFHTAVWTGSEMIVWGGASPSLERSGGRYDPFLNTWAATSGSSAPDARYLHTAIWTGSEMIVWGGLSSNGFELTDTNTGGRYDPVSDNWGDTTTSNAPQARDWHTAVWTDDEMIVWGGREYDQLDDDSFSLDTGGKYNPDTGTWTAMTARGAPTPRYGHTAVWTGGEMIVWGGFDIAFGDAGGRYDPGQDSWTSISTVDAPGNRAGHTAVWTGSEMIVWGVGDSGDRYDPLSDSWSSIALGPDPGERYWHSAVWTGSEMIVWGGTYRGISRADGGRYDPDADTWTPTATNVPSPRYDHTAVWTGSEMIVWGGYNGSSYLNTGGRYEAATDTWHSITTVAAPEGRSLHTAVWSGSEMIVWAGEVDGGEVRTGGLYSPTTGLWAAMTSNGPAARSGHTAVWTGEEMIIWGGGTASGFLGVGDRYDPTVDQWSPISSIGSPSARADHTAVWTGSEMIVWGGGYGGFSLSDGGRYDPDTDTWTPTSAIDAPVERRWHSAVWTGSEMIVWGGFGGGTIGYLDSGGRYDPSADTWSQTPAAGSPSAQGQHSAVWTGNEMLVWGHGVKPGGRYSPSGDSWAPITTEGAPAGRLRHTAVWTGDAMIVSHGRSVSGDPLMDYGIYTIIPPPDELFRDRFEQ